MPTATLVVVALLTLCACAPTPSRQPLGVGPLPPGAKLAAELRKEARSRKTARSGNPPRQRDAKTEPSDAPEDKPDRPSPSPAAPVAKADTRPAGSGSAQPDGAVAIADPSGEYRGDDVSAYKLSGLPDRTEKDPNARVNVRKSGEKTFDFALVDSSNGKDICTLSGTLEGRVATIGAGQSCFEQDTGAASATATVTRGTATFENTRLVLDLVLDFELLLGDDEHTGTLDYHFDGTRR